MSDWKAKNREWTANYKRETREHEEAQKAQREARAKQNAILRANGYRWTKFAGSAEDDAFGGTYDEWVLYAPDGTPTTVSKAMAAIEGKPAQATIHDCAYIGHSKCNDPACVCDCHKSTGSALLAPEPERHEETVQTWGGKREGAGRPENTAKAETREPLYQAGYNAGYQAASRTALKSGGSLYCGTCKSEPCLVFRYDGVEPICCHDMVRYGYCQHEPLNPEPYDSRP